MRLQKRVFIFLITCAILLAAGCARKTVADSGTVAEQETDTDRNEINVESPNDEQPIAEIVGWQAAVGEWEDENGLGYTMRISENEAKTDMLFSISFTPYGGVFLDWVLPCKLVANDEALYYDKGVMTYLEFVPDENGDPIADSSVEKRLVGSFSLSPDQNTLCWYNGPEGDTNPINFVQTQSKVNEPAEILINGIPYAVADADGWGDAWKTIAEIIRNGTDIYFKEAEEDPSLYGSGNAWDDITIEGITYEMAAKHGWGDTWWEAANHFGSDYDAYIGSEAYDEFSDEFSEQGSNSSGELSNTELKQINSQVSLRLANEWKNAYNRSVSRDSIISNTQVRDLIAKIEINGSMATVTTEIYYWLVNKGGSPAGSVYSVVIIDVSNGDVLSATIAD